MITHHLPKPISKTIVQPSVINHQNNKEDTREREIDLGNGDSSSPPIQTELSLPNSHTLVCLNLGVRSYLYYELKYSSISDYSEESLKAFEAEVLESLELTDRWINRYDKLTRDLSILCALTIGLIPITRTTVARSMGTEEEDNTPANITLDVANIALPAVTAGAVSISKYNRDRLMDIRQKLVDSLDVISRFLGEPSLSTSEVRGNGTPPPKTGCLPRFFSCFRRKEQHTNEEPLSTIKNEQGDHGNPLVKQQENNNPLSLDDERILASLEVQNNQREEYEIKLN